MKELEFVKPGDIEKEVLPSLQKSLQCGILR